MPDEKNRMSDKREVKVKQFTAALAQMRESELARLLNMVETLTQALRLISLHNCESVAAATTVRRLSKLWNSEVECILKAKRENDAAV